MSQHSQNPYLVEDPEDQTRWKINKGKVIHTPNSSRIGYKAKLELVNQS